MMTIAASNCVLPTAQSICRYHVRVNEIGLNIEGMYCDHCASTVEKAIRTVSEVSNVRMEGNVAWITFSGALQPALARACEAVGDAGYGADAKHVITPRGDGRATARLKAIGTFALIVAGIIVAAQALEALVGYNVFNAIPAVDSSLTYGALFSTGLLTGLHCLSMCGALNLAAATSGQASGIANADMAPSVRTKRSRPSLSPVAYNLGRLISYTSLGALAGAAGAVFGIDKRVSTALILIAGVIMMLMALRMAGIVNMRMPFPRIAAFERLRARGKRSGAPFVMGLANGLMPCGPLQSMQLYAIGTGDAAAGAAAMFLFCLGTIPFMLAIGYSARALGARSKAIIAKAAAAFMFTLAASMVGRGLVFAGVDLTAPLSNTQVVQAQVAPDRQIAEFDLSFDNYADISLKKGIPAQLVINVDAEKLTGCNNKVVIDEWGIEQALEPGRNIIEFTPDKSGTYVYSCWMRMITNTIEVSD